MRLCPGVRTKRYTYTTLMDHEPWLLYDNQEDPYQLDNLINKSEQAELQANWKRECVN